MREPSEEIARRVRSEVAFGEVSKAEADGMATTLIQGYIGPDHKVVSLPNSTRHWHRRFGKRVSAAAGTSF